LTNPTFGRSWTYEIRNENGFAFDSRDLPDDTSAQEWFETFRQEGYSGKYFLYRIKMEMDQLETLLLVKS
jgi:hypothetical protein